MIKVQNSVDSHYFYNVKLKLSSLLEGPWSPKLDNYNSSERSTGDTPPQELVTSSQWGMWFWKIPTHLHIWVYEYLRYKYLSKTHDQVVMMGRGASSVLFRGIFAVQFCWSTETSPEWRYLHYCFIKLIFQSNTVLYLYLFKFYSICVMSVCKQKVYMREISQAKTNRHLCLFQIYTLSS